MKAASVYGRLGWSVIPLHSAVAGVCSCSKGSSCPSAGKHPRLNDWVGEASSDAEQIAEWIAQWPSGNVGVVTGAASGFWALDSDPKNGGPDTLADLLAEHGELPVTPRARTGSGGEHILFSNPEGFRVPNTAGKIGAGLDTRGEGGQIVVAPSVSAKGPYTWLVPPWNTPVAPAPDWLIAMLRRAPAKPASSSTPKNAFPPPTPEVIEAARSALEAHGPAVEGQGGDLHTFLAACILRNDFAFSDEEAWPLLLEWNEGCQPAWNEDDLRSKLRGGSKYASKPFGCRRSLDALQTVRSWIAEWQRSGLQADPEGLALIQRSRDLVRDLNVDPVIRSRIEEELKSATGLGVTALSIPRTKVRPVAVEVTGNLAGLDLTSSGAPQPNMNNAVRILEREQRNIYFDSFLQKVMTGEGANAEEWGDANDLDLTLYLQRERGLTKIPPQVVSQAVQTYAHGRQRNIVREELERIVWDRTGRIDTFFTRALGAEDTEYVRAASQNFWKSAVARPLRPGCKSDHMPVLEGPQGAGKSSALRVIGGRFFAEASESPHSKDFYQVLQGKLIVEIGEMDAFSRSDVAAVKRALSCSIDRYRAPYERAPRDWPRQGIFVGTTNRSDWARDDTGGRRFWPIVVGRVDLEYIKSERTQLFAEAVHRVNAGESWWEMPAEATLAEQEARRQVHPWEEKIADHLATSQSREFTVTDLLTFPLERPISQMTKADQMNVAAILRRLGCARVDGWRNGRKQKFWRWAGGEGATQ